MVNTTGGQASATRGFFIEGQAFSAPTLPPALYVVATPIGNLGDITIRALQTLAGADRIACEDTRRSATLMRHFSIKAPLFPYHEHNAARQRPKLLSMIKDGEAVALITDAGTPLVSDPGYKLVKDCAEAGIDVVPLPGASAMLAGLSGAGLPSDRFWFEGFLPAKSKARRDRIAEIAAIPGTLILFEAPSRLAASLSDLLDILGDREAVVARELTKLHETFARGTLASLTADFGSENIKGEIVLMIGPPGAVEIVEPDDLQERLEASVREHGARTASEMLALETGLEKKRLYKMGIGIAQKLKSGDE